MAERHRLSAIDPDARTATCSVCGPGVRIRSKGRWWGCRTVANRNKRYRGEDTYRWGTRKPYREHVTDTCEGCGFVAEDVRLLDVHHLNGDHRDNRPENLATLCPVCHRREHYGLALPLHPAGG